MCVAPARSGSSAERPSWQLNRIQDMLSGGSPFAGHETKSERDEDEEPPLRYVPLDTFRALDTFRLPIFCLSSLLMQHRFGYVVHLSCSVYLVYSVLSVARPPFVVKLIRLSCFNIGEGPLGGRMRYHGLRGMHVCVVFVKYPDDEPEVGLFITRAQHPYSPLPSPRQIGNQPNDVMAAPHGVIFSYSLGAIRVSRPR